MNILPIFKALAASILGFLNPHAQGVRLRFKTPQSPNQDFKYEEYITRGWRALSKRDLSILFANSLDHFDTSIYAFLAPVLGAIFFPDHEPIVQLILAYSVVATSVFTRPVGAYISGVIAKNYGAAAGLSYSLLGVSLATLMIGCIPSHAEIGGLAPFALIIIRMLKGLCASGETTIAKLYIMDGKDEPGAIRASYLYQCSTMYGIISASAVATFLIAYNPEAWRVLFIAVGLLGCAMYYLLRYRNKTPTENTMFESYKASSLGLLWSNREGVLRVATIISFSHVTYTIPFIFMNSFVPLVTSISLKTMMELNTILLIFDTILIHIMGPIIAKMSPSKVMGITSLILGMTIIPLFQAIPGSSIEYVIFARVWIVFWGVAFMCPMNFWLKGLFKGPEQYFLVGMGNALGAATIGRTITPLCLWAWYTTQSCEYIGGVIAVIMVGTFYVVCISRR